jgi:soluble lytic murein transglycosylase
MRGPSSKYIALLPEAGIVLVLGGLIATLSGLGTQSARLKARSLLTPATPNASVAVAAGTKPRPAAVMMPPEQLAAAIYTSNPHPAAKAQLTGQQSPSPGALIFDRGSKPDSLTGKIFAMSAAKPDPAPALLADPSRIEHARELLGKFYERSVVKSGEKVAEVDKFVRHWTDRALRKAYKKYAKVIADTVMKEAERHGFDPVFLMAVIENESSFNLHAIGPVGEIGLMQITPATGEWIARKYGIKWEGKHSLHDPRTNIRIGAAYLAYLREEFDSHSQLYLAAYNMGSLNVNRALEKSIWPKDYPQRVMKRYLRFYGDLKAELKSAAAIPKT